MTGQGGPNSGSFGQTTPSPEKGIGAEGHPNPGQLVLDASPGDSSSGESADAGADSDASVEAGGPFACGSVMCIPPMQYCSITKTSFGSNTSYQCTQTPFNCGSGPTCACVQPFDGGTGCTCADDSGAVTLTCPY